MAVCGGPSGPLFSATEEVRLGTVTAAPEPRPGNYRQTARAAMEAEAEWRATRSTSIVTLLGCKQHNGRSIKSEIHAQCQEAVMHQCVSFHFDLTLCDSTQCGWEWTMASKRINNNQKNPIWKILKALGGTVLIADCKSD